MSLIAWYPLGTNFNDYSGNNYHATDSGTQLDTNGKTIEYSRYFDSADTITASFVYPVTWFDPISISTWIYIPTIATWNTNFGNTPTLEYK